MRIAAILVNWNNTGDTASCLESLKACRTKGSEDVDLHVIVVDNNSDTQNTGELEAIEHADNSGLLTVLYNQHNNGLAAGYNTGLRHCKSHISPDAIWLLNNDTIVDNRCLQALAHGLVSHPEVKIWGSTIYSMATPDRPFCKAGFRYLAALSIPVPLGFSNTAIPSASCVRLPAMDYVSGISMCVRAGCFEEGTLLDESYFLYYEELELVRKVGGKQFLAWCPESIIHHKGGGSTNSLNPNKGKGSVIAHYYGNRSALLYTWRHHPWYFPLVFFFRLLAKSLLFVRYGEWGGFRPLLKAYVDFLIPGGMRRRIEDQGSAE